MKTFEEMILDPESFLNPKPDPAILNLSAAVESALTMIAVSSALNSGSEEVLSYIFDTTRRNISERYGEDAAQNFVEIYKNVAMAIRAELTEANDKGESNE